MANRRTLSAVAAAILMPSILVVAVATPASAKVITPSGNVTCQVGGSLGFSPPLTPGNGTPNVSDESVSITLALSNCAGSSNPVGQVPTDSTSVVTKAVKIKAVKIGRTKYAGGCNTFGSAIKATSFKSTITWNNGIKLSKTTLGNVQLNEIAPENAISANGSATKSFDGLSFLNAQLDSSSSTALGTCLVGSGPSVASVTFDSSTSSITLRPVTAYVTNEGADTVVPIDTATNTAGTPITGLLNPFAFAITPNGESAYASDFVGPSVTPINLVTNTAGTPITVGTHFEGVGGIAITPDGTTAYVTEEGDNTVVPIDTANNTAGTPIPVASPVDIAMAPNGATAYVVDEGVATVTPIDTANNAAGTPISVSADPDAIAIAPDGATAYVVTGNDETGNLIPIDLATNTAGTAIPLDTSVGLNRIAITPNGTTAYVTNEIGIDGNTITPVDLVTDTAEPAIAITNQPFGIAITPNGATAYVVSGTDTFGTVTPIDTATNTTGTPISVGAGSAFGIAIG
jgi:YVTN family beta-propeller protein